MNEGLNFGHKGIEKIEFLYKYYYKIIALKFKYTLAIK